MTDGRDPFDCAAVTDVVIVLPHADDSGWEEREPAGTARPVRLLDDLTLGRLPEDQVERYVAACEPRNLNFNLPADSGHRYAFVRHPAPFESVPTMPRFDPDGILNAAVSLSRYLTLNAHSTECAARRIEGLRNDGLSEIIAVPPENRFYAWSARDGSRTHLTDQDADELGRLLATYLADRSRLPPRITLAMWFCEHSFRQHFYEIAMVHVVTAFDSLIKVGRWDASKQFRQRVPALAREVKMEGIDRRRARAFYSRRSRSVHGQPLSVTVATPATRELAVMQRLLTRVLRTAIEDREFRALFTAGNIKRRWPLRPERRRR